MCAFTAHGNAEFDKQLCQSRILLSTKPRLYNTRRFSYESEWLGNHHERHTGSTLFVSCVSICFFPLSGKIASPSLMQTNQTLHKEIILVQHLSLFGQIAHMDGNTNGFRLPCLLWTRTGRWTAGVSTIVPHDRKTWLPQAVMDWISQPGHFEQAISN